MSIEFQENYGPLSEEDLIKFEEQHALERFPEDYREFLKKYNGGMHPQREVFKFKRGGKSYGSILDCLFGIKKAPVYALMEPQYRKENDPAKTQFISIGYDAGGNSIEMSLRDYDFGSIHFWDGDLPFNTNDSAERSVFFVASSFTEFINNLLTVKQDRELTAREKDSEARSQDGES